MRYSFLLLFGLLLMVYHRLPAMAQRGLLLGFSIFFYARAGWVSLGLMVLAAAICYGAALAMDRWPGRRGILWSCLAANFSLLALCRFCFPAGAMPVGISFYLLQGVGYCVDVYRGTIRAERGALRFGLFLSFFPQMEQGPIGKYDTLSRELSCGRKYDPEQVSAGLARMCGGISKSWLWRTDWPCRWRR